MKKFLLIGLLIILGLVVSAVVLPYIFKHKIVAKAKQAINENLNATVNFGDFDISLFRHFPKLTLSIDNFQIVGQNEFKADTLASIKQFEIALNIMSVIKNEQITVNSIYLNQPRIKAKVLANGKANWDIMKPEPASSSSDAKAKPFKLSLSKYEIIGGYIVYDDKSLMQSATLTNVHHIGSGDFTSEIFNLITSTSIEQLTYNYNGITYLNKVKTDYDAEFSIDAKNSKYTFKENKLKLNALLLSFQGWLAMPKDDIDMDIQFATKSTDFKDLFSLIPGAYTKDFADVKTAGSIAFNGNVKGIYNDTRMPSYSVNLKADHAMVQYPSLPKAIQNINLNMTASCADGITDHLLISIPACHFEMDKAPFDFELKLSQPTAAMNIDLKAKGKLDLGELNKMFPMEGVTKLMGMLDADLTAKGSLAEVQKKNYGNFDAQGKLSLQNMEYASKDFNKGSSVKELVLSFNPRNVKLEKCDARVSNTSLTASGTLDNLFHYVFKNEMLKGIINVKADYFNVDEWMTSDASTTSTTSSKPATSNDIFKVPGNLDFELTTAINKVKYDKMDITNLAGNIVVRDEKMSMRGVSMNMLEGKMVLDGSYSTKNTQLPDIDLKYNITDFDIQKSFKTFNTVQKIAPIAEYTRGKFSTNLTMTGKMLADMTPDLNTINGDGYFTIFNGVISNFKPIQKIVEVLQMSQYAEFPIHDIKTWFEIRNGRIEVKPFDLKTKDMVMNISGFQSLDQKMDYTIKMDMPRKLLGAAANATIEQALAAANAKAGTNVTASERIKFDVMLGGSITNPTVKTGLKDALKGKANELKDNLKAEAEAKAKAEIDKQKADAEAKAKAELDKQKADAEAKAKAAADKAKADAEAKAKAELDKQKKAAEDAAKKKAKDALNGLFKK